MKTKYTSILTGLLTFLFCLLLAGSVGATNYTLTLVAQGSGTVSKNPTNSSYPSGATVTITATPNAGWYFANWSGDINNTTSPLNVTMNSNMVITGNFLAYPTYSVALVTNGQGGIALSPSGGNYLSNTVVTATATPAAGWEFVAWFGATNSSANPVSFAVNTNVSLTGYFAQLPAFDVQPVSVTNKAGNTVNFTSHAVGTAPLGYTWYFGGGTLTNATSATLSLTNVTTSQAGNYWVVATNNYGSATSSIVSLTLTNPVGPTNVVSSPDQGGLQAAIALGGWVGIGFSGTITLTNTITITNNVILDGTGVGATISGGNAVQLFNVANAASLTISNLTLANGGLSVTNGPAEGGAVYNNGSVTFIHCTLTNNTARSLVWGGSALGGAVFNNGGSVQLIQTSASNNVAIGGGPYNYNNSYAAGSGLGGAFYSVGGSLTIVGCDISSNLCEGISPNLGAQGSGVSMGGAAYVTAGSFTATNSVFGRNIALGCVGVGTSVAPSGPAYGGAVAILGGNAVINLSQFFANSAIGGNAGYHAIGGPAFGGAVYSASAVMVSDSSFFGNQTLAGNYSEAPTTWMGVNGCGGGIFNSNAIVLIRCTICSNYVQGGSGVAYPSAYVNGGNGLGGGVFNASQCAATNCTIALNYIEGGMGQYDYGPPATNGLAMGGGIFNNSGATFLAMNLTIASNNCASPPSGYQITTGFAAGYQIANTNGTLRVHNTLIAYSGTNSNAYGPITDDGYNICSDGSAALFSGSSYNYTDPQLAPLGNYGGPTLTMALLASSPAIDNGDPNGAPNTDQRGYLRPASDVPDMGAYEYGAVALVAPTLAISAGGTNLLLSFTAYPASTYYLQYSTNLANWSGLSTNGPFTSQTNITQTIGKQSFNHCYFRLLMQ